jgi:hypothetical protein
MRAARDPTSCNREPLRKDDIQKTKKFKAAGVLTSLSVGHRQFERPMTLLGLSAQNPFRGFECDGGVTSIDVFVQNQPICRAMHVQLSHRLASSVAWAGSSRWGQALLEERSDVGREAVDTVSGVCLD